MAKSVLEFSNLLQENPTVTNIKRFGEFLLLKCDIFIFKYIYLSFFISPPPSFEQFLVEFGGLDKLVVCSGVFSDVKSI
jgi:hypothetical protein